MTSVYEQELPKAFPYHVRMSSGLADRAVSVLRSPLYRTTTPSSFALTSECAPREVTLWLSRVSWERLMTLPVFNRYLKDLKPSWGRFLDDDSIDEE